MELIKAKEELDANRIILDFPDVGIQVLNGRFGPYITDRVKNAKIPKDRDPKSLTLEECRELIAAAPVRRGRFGAKTPMKQAAKQAPAASVKDEKPAKAKKTAKTASPAKSTAKKSSAKTKAAKTAKAARK